MQRLILTLLFLLVAVPAHADRSVRITWAANTEPDLAGYKLYYGFMGCGAVGPMQPVTTLGKVTAHTMNFPDSTLVVSARLTAFDIKGNESPQSLCVEQTWEPPYDPKPEIEALKAKLAGICRAAKAMGGTATSFAGRIRKEVPCL